MSKRKKFSGDWATDTVDERVKSINDNRYIQGFTNKGYVVKLYPMDQKSETGAALKLFCKEFEVPERLTLDGSKKQNCKNTMYIKQIFKNIVSIITPLNLVCTMKTQQKK